MSRDRKWRHSFLPVRDLPERDHEHWLVVEAVSRKPFWRGTRKPNWMIDCTLLEFRLEHRSGGGASGPTLRDFSRGHATLSVTVAGQTLTVRVNRYYWNETREHHAAKVALWERKRAVVRAVQKTQGCPDDEWLWPSRSGHHPETVGLSEGRVAVVKVAGTAHCHKCRTTLEFTEEQMQLMETRA